MKCENPNHKGDPYKNQGEGIWVLKLPSAFYWCPNCQKEWFIKQIRKYKCEKK